MLGKKHYILILLTASLLILNACNIGGAAQPQVVQPVQIEAEVTAQPTNTKLAFPTAMPTNTYTPQVTIQVCNPDDAIDMMKKLVPYPEFEMFYYNDDTEMYLNIWFLDPALNANATYEQLDENVMIAQDHAMVLAQQLNFAEECLDNSFDNIGFTIVDGNYNTWFYAEIHTSLLPDDIQTDPEHLAILNSRFEVTYRRWDVPEPLPTPPNGSCRWKDIYPNILAHFGGDKKNSGFYYYTSESERKIVAQWEGTYAEMASEAYLTSLEYITDEIACLFPEPANIDYYLVDDSASFVGYGRLYLPDPANPDFYWDNYPYLMESD